MTRKFETLESRRFLTAAQYADFNHDGAFNADDLLEAMAAGKYETGESATYDEGDANGDGVFDSSDLMFIMEGGYYGQSNPKLPVVNVCKNTSRIEASPEVAERYDENGDGFINFEDVEIVVEALDVVWGDTDFDGEVNHEVYAPGPPQGRTPWSRGYNGGTEIYDQAHWTLGDMDCSRGSGLGDLKLVYGEDVDPNDFYTDDYLELFGD